MGFEVWGMRNINNAIIKALLKVGERIRERAIDKAPYITGALKKSITLSLKKDSVIVWAGGGGAPYAVYVHEGTKPHIIRPVKKKALASKNKIFGKKVNHPGTKPNPFLLVAAKETSSEIDKLIGNDISKAVAENIKNQLRDIKIEIKL